MHQDRSAALLPGRPAVDMAWHYGCVAGRRCFKRVALRCAGVGRHLAEPTGRARAALAVMHGEMLGITGRTASLKVAV